MSIRKRLMYLIVSAGICSLSLILVQVNEDFFYRSFQADDFVVFHLVVEIASIIVSFAIFSLGWFGYKQRPDIRNLAIAITFFMVGALDFIHVVAFPGMPDFLSPNSTDKAAIFWIAARLIAAFGLLIVALLPAKAPPKWLHPRLLLATAFFLVTSLTLLASYTEIIPRMFIEDVGLTRLKYGLEYLVIAVDFGVIAILWKRMLFNIRSTTFLQTALVIGIFSELAFTLYANAFDTYNFLGHIFKDASYYFILRAIFVTSLQQPYVELEQTREDLERSFDSIGLALSSSLGLNRTLDIIVKQASELLRSPYALVALQQREPDSLTVLATHGFSDAPSVIPLKENLASKVWHDHEPVWIDDINSTSQPYPSVMTGGGFNSAVAAPILKDDSILGEIAVYSHQRRAYNKPEARLLAAFARQAAIAIENARLFQEELNARNRIQNYVSQLSILHNIGLSLNRETDRNRLLKMVLYRAAELTKAGVGIMTLIVDGQTEVISEYYAPFYEQQCNITAQPANMHKRIDMLIGDEDATRIQQLDNLEMLPEGHIALDGLLIGTLRDTHGRTVGYFMLSDKAGGATFSSEDEEIISLLATQSSVALVSAENFAKEHRVAETLQEALLPGIPDRDDVEVGLLYRSTDIYGKVGGDFYDFIELDESRIAVVVGDVCGKGLEAATYTAMIKYMLRAYLGEGMLPGDCLMRLNQEVARQLPPDKFITAALAVIDTASQVISYSSAGHPHPCICHSGKTALLSTPQSIPLGVLPEYKFMSTQISIAGACSIFMYSDGLIEARPKGQEPFGEQRLLETLAGRCCDSPQSVANDALQAALAYSGDELRDDIAIVAVKFKRKPSA